MIQPGFLRRLFRASPGEACGRPVQQRRRWGWMGLAGMVLMSGSAQPPRAEELPSLAVPTIISPAPDEIVQASARDEVTLEQLIARAKKTYAGVTDYTCTFVKQEQIQGRLMPMQTAQMKVRTQPFSVHLKFVAPSDVAGQEACYVQGKNGNKMRAKGAGWKGAIGFVTLDPKDSRAMQGNRHCITEAGLGMLIDKLAASVKGGEPGDFVVQMAVYQFNQMPCTRVDIRQHPQKLNPRSPYGYRSVIYFDQATGLPVRYENYDFPRGGAEGALLECYSYIDLKLNRGLTDRDFAY